MERAMILASCHPSRMLAIAGTLGHGDTTSRKLLIGDHTRTLFINLPSPAVPPKNARRSLPVKTRCALPKLFGLLGATGKFVFSGTEPRPSPPANAVSPLFDSDSDDRAPPSILGSSKLPIPADFSVAKGLGAAPLTTV